MTIADNNSNTARSQIQMNSVSIFSIFRQSFLFWVWLGQTWRDNKPTASFYQTKSIFRLGYKFTSRFKSNTIPRKNMWGLWYGYAPIQTLHSCSNEGLVVWIIEARIYLAWKEWFSLTININVRCCWGTLERIVMKGYLRIHKANFLSIIV